MSVTGVAHNGDAHLHYVVDGPDAAPALLLIHAVGTNLDMWQGQVDAFARHYRVIRYDARGHGLSTVPKGQYTIADLGGDALAVLDACGVDAAHLCGLSIGGLTALWLAIHAPARVASLILANTAARIGSTESWTNRIALVRAQGMNGVVSGPFHLWFSEDFHRHESARVAQFRDTLAACSPHGYIGCCAALRDADLRADLGNIGRRTLVIAGAVDVSTPVAHAEVIRQGIPDATRLTLHAAHFSNIEQPSAFNAAVLDFLSTPGRHVDG